MKIRLGILISGRGSNLAALIRACDQPDYPAEIAIVISDRETAPGLKLAADAGIPNHYIPHPSRTGFAMGAGWPLVANKVDLIILAGFMRVLHVGFVLRWHDRIINIHPSLLPNFPGLHPYRQALDAGVKHSGCTVHWVVPEVDAGSIIAQMAVRVEPTDTEDTLSARILETEHQLYPYVVEHIAKEMLK